MQFLGDIDPDEVSPVRRGAQGRRFAFAKSDTADLDPALLDVLDIPFEREGALVDELRKADADPDAQRAAVAVVRLLKGFGLDPDTIAKAMSPAANADPDDDGDDDDEVSKAYDAAIAKKAYTADQRQRMAANGEAMPGGRYPIADRDDLENAIDAVGRGKGSHAKIRAHIAARARALGATSLLPDSWQVSKAAGDGGSTTKGQHMSDTAAPAVPIRKEDGSWDLSGVPEEARGFYDSVLKAADTARAESEALRERVAKAETEAASAHAQLREREFVAKADSEYGKLAPADELGPVLKEAQDSLDADTFAKLEAILKGANERVEKGDLFADLGTKVMAGQPVATAAAVRDASTGDAWGKIEKLADSIVEKANGDITQEQAVARVLKTAEGSRLYAEYLGDYMGGVA